ncbi:MAG: hypothetical protein K2H47_12015 [Muribaculaceae bacterium]|nr:hypothetical protein [Muribaculaceae bacterium]
MSKLVYLALGALVSIGIVSCDENAQLASKIEGVWSGNATVLSKKDGNKEKQDNTAKPMEAKINSITPSFTFTPDPSVKNGGKLTYSGVYSVSQPVSSQSVDVPFEATADVKVTGKGTWTAKDDDEIIVMIDASTVSTTVDTASVTLGYAVLTDKPVTELEALKEQILPNINSSFSAEVQKRVTSIHKLDDIKIKGSEMTLEIGKTDFTFNKQ